jgi:antitoxin MazE
MNMETRIKKWDDSLALRIPQVLADEAGLDQDSPVELTLEAGRLIITLIPDNKPRLEDLLAGVTPGNIHREVNMGDPMGDVAW